MDWKENWRKKRCGGKEKKRPLEIKIFGGRGDKPLPAAYRTGATMLLLFLHLSEDSFFLDLDEAASFVFFEGEPELFYSLALLC